MIPTFRPVAIVYSNRLAPLDEMRIKAFGSAFGKALHNKGVFPLPIDRGEAIESRQIVWDISLERF